MSDTRLKSIYSRWLRLEEAKQEISDDLKELFKEAKGDGYDGKAIRAAFRKVAKLEGDKAEEIREQDALVDLYIDALTRDAREAVSYAEATGREPTVSKIEKVQPETAIQFQAKASEDNGATGYSRTEAKADCMTGEVSRVDAGRTASATSEVMDVTAGETAPIPDEGIPAFLKRDRKPYREGCQHPEPGRCGAGGPGLCHSCKKAMAEVEAA